MRALVIRDDDNVLRRIDRTPQKSTLTVLRYLSESKQYNIKLEAAFTVTSKLKILFNTEIEQIV